MDLAAVLPAKTQTGRLDEAYGPNLKTKWRKQVSKYTTLTRLHANGARSFLIEFSIKNPIASIFK
jgi:hypothetical protein